MEYFIFKIVCKNMVTEKKIYVLKNNNNAFMDVLPLPNLAIKLPL